MAHEFDGARYAEASAHQKEWGTTLIAELNLQGTDVFSIRDAATARLLPRLQPSSHVGKSWASTPRRV